MRFYNKKRKRNRNAIILANGFTKTRRKIYESAAIASIKNINQSPGSHELATSVVYAVSRVMT